MRRAVGTSAIRCCAVGFGGKRNRNGLCSSSVASEGVNQAERLALESAIRQLPPEQREVVHLHVFEGWTFQEVANACGESINTVASGIDMQWRGCAKPWRLGE
jgi:hypothetical protein